MKKRKKQNNMPIVIAIITAFIISILLFLGMRQTSEEKTFDDEGYETTEEEAFYKKVLTNNTLDDYYQDISNNKDSSYQEYYVSKKSYQFIELKLDYQQEVNKTLNITSDLRTGDVNFNYEVTYKSAHLILEGNSKDNYTCQIVTMKNVKDSNVQEQCNEIMKEISTFLTKKEELLQNKKISDIVNQPEIEEQE